MIRASAVKCANATAAAVATLSESTPGAIGMRTHASAADRAAAVRPGPSAPSKTAQRSGGATDGQWHRLGPRRQRQKGEADSPATFRAPPATDRATRRRARATRDPSTPGHSAGRADRRSERSSRTASTPNAAALRNSEPRFSKSFSDSRTATRVAPARTSATDACGRSVRRRKHPAGQAKTHHIRQEPPIGGVDGQIRKAGQHVREHVEPSGLTEYCSRLIAGGQQSLDNGDALGNDHATPIRPHVRIGEVAEIR